MVRRLPGSGCGRYFEQMGLLLLLPLVARAQILTPLAARGFTLLPAPQKVEFDGPNIRFAAGWQLELGVSVKPDDVAVESLTQGLSERFGLSVATPGKDKQVPSVIRLAIEPGSVPIGPAADANRAALAAQAYRLSIKPQRIAIAANAAPGLLYGVESLVQLIRQEAGGFSLPQGEITDWPDLELRVIYWDDAHHLDHLEVLKDALREAAFFKINGFAIKLEGHFQYHSVPAIVDPYALAPAELQALTDYALKYHIQLIPYLDGPAHDAFILKHPELASLREFPESNYEFCATNPGTYSLFSGMYDDLLRANRGSRYFILSTDEPYYVGLAKDAQCDEKDRAAQLDSVGKLLAEFVTKTAGYLHEHGREVIFWGEYPLVPQDISALPDYLINGEVYGPAFDPVFKAHGIRQMIYVSTEGEEPLFPNYYQLPPEWRLHPRPAGEGRVADMWDHISFTSARGQASLMGAFVAGWADEGLHPETFWLGYATGPAAAWHPASPDPSEQMNDFYRLFYGPHAVHMGRLYQLMSLEAEFWEDSWERMASSARTPIFGNSYQIFHPPRPAHDQTLPPLPVPSPELLQISYDWAELNQKRLNLAGGILPQSDELLDLLHANLERPVFHRYNLEVFLSIAQLCRQNLEMLQQMQRMSGLLGQAQTRAAAADAPRALAAIDRALDLAELIREQRNTVLQAAVRTWYKTWFPRVAAANGRQYLDRVDDVKDHRPVRTVDMSYLVYRELLFPMGDWVEKTLAARNGYAELHHLPARALRFDWKDTSTVLANEPPAEEE